MEKLTRRLFWKGIKEINWDDHYDSNLAKVKMLNFCYEKGLDPADFGSMFSLLVAKINVHTTKRDKVFAKGISYGGDDCHFMDLPAHLIGKGNAAVKEYLGGGVINFKPVECLSYMFHKK